LSISFKWHGSGKVYTNGPPTVMAKYNVQFACRSSFQAYGLTNAKISHLDHLGGSAN
jgi:hypothetical protein